MNTSSTFGGNSRHLLALGLVGCISSHNLPTAGEVSANGRPPTSVPAAIAATGGSSLDSKENLPSPCSQGKEAEEAINQGRYLLAERLLTAPQSNCVALEPRDRQTKLAEVLYARGAFADALKAVAAARALAAPVDFLNELLGKIDSEQKLRTALRRTHAKAALQALDAARTARRSGRYDDCIRIALSARAMHWPLAQALWEATECASQAGRQVDANRYAATSVVDTQEQKLSAKWSSVRHLRRARRIFWTKRNTLVAVEEKAYKQSGFRAWEFDPIGDGSDLELAPRDLKWTETPDLMESGELLPGAWHTGVSASAVRVGTKYFQLWRLDDDKVLWSRDIKKDSYPKLRNPGTRLLLSPNGSELLWSDGWTIRRFRARDGTVLPMLELRHSSIESLRVAPRATWIALALHARGIEKDDPNGLAIMSYPFTDGSPSFKMIEHKDVRSVPSTFEALDTRHVAVECDPFEGVARGEHRGGFCIFDALSRQLKLRIQVPGGGTIIRTPGPRAIIVNGTRLVGISRDTKGNWLPDQLVYEPGNPDTFYDELEISEDGNYAAGWSDNGIVVWSTLTGRVTRKIETHAQDYCDSALDAAQDRVLEVTTDQALIVDFAKQTTKVISDGKNGFFRGAAWTSEGPVTFGTKGTRLWLAQGAATLRDPEIPSDDWKARDFISAGRWICRIVCGESRTSANLRCIDQSRSDGALVVPFPPRSKIAFSADGLNVAVTQLTKDPKSHNVTMYRAEEFLRARGNPKNALCKVTVEGIDLSNVQSDAFHLVLLRGTTYPVRHHQLIPLGQCHIEELERYEDRALLNELPPQRRNAVMYWLREHHWFYRGGTRQLRGSNSRLFFPTPDLTSPVLLGSIEPLAEGWFFSEGGRSDDPELLGLQGVHARYFWDPGRIGTSKVELIGEDAPKNMSCVLDGRFYSWPVCRDVFERQGLMWETLK